VAVPSTQSSTQLTKLHAFLCFGLIFHHGAETALVSHFTFASTHWPTFTLKNLGINGYATKYNTELQPQIIRLSE
jgi:hypothetical protein